jgi:uncharacterized protein YcbX
VGRVDHIFMTPVKGTTLHSMDEAVVTEHGIPDDRRFFVIDERDRLTNGRRHGPLVMVQSRFDPRSSVLTLVFPDGTTVAGTAAPTGQPVSVHFFDHYVAGHEVPGPWQAALSEFCGRPVRLIQADVAGHGLDLHPLTLLGSSSIEWLRGRAAAGVLDRRRFRTSLEIAGTSPFNEDTWIGHPVTIGDVVAEVIGKVPRCRVTRQDPETGRPDVDTLRMLVDSYRDRAIAAGGTPPAAMPAGGEEHISFAVYGRVLRPGRVRVGDPVVVRN